MARAGLLLITVILSVVSGIQFRQQQQRQYFQGDQPIRAVHFQNGREPTRENPGVAKTRWILRTGQSRPPLPPPRQSILQQMLMRPLIRQRMPVLRMRNPFASMSPKRTHIPPPIKVRCCVRHSPGFQAQIVDMGTPMRQGARIPWDGLGYSDGQGSSYNSLYYDIPFPEYPNFQTSSPKLGEPATTEKFPTKNNSSETGVDPRNKNSKSLDLKKAKSKAEKKLKDSLDDVPEPFRSWILAGEKNGTKKSSGKNE